MKPKYFQPFDLLLFLESSIIHRRIIKMEGDRSFQRQNITLELIIDFPLPFFDA